TLKAAQAWPAENRFAARRITLRLRQREQALRFGGVERAFATFLTRCRSKHGGQRCSRYAEFHQHAKADLGGVRMGLVLFWPFPPILRTRPCAAKPPQTTGRDPIHLSVIAAAVAQPRWPPVKR